MLYTRTWLFYVLDKIAYRYYMTMYGLVLSDVKRARKMPWNDILITLFARFSITLNDSYWLMWMFYLKLIKYNTKSLYMNFIMNMIL